MKSKYCRVKWKSAWKRIKGRRYIKWEKWSSFLADKCVPILNPAYTNMPFELWIQVLLKSETKIDWVYFSTVTNRLYNKKKKKLIDTQSLYILKEHLIVIKL